MSLKQILFKPKWESKDPEIRAAAVAGSKDPELLELLRRISLEDPEFAVRAAAIRRLTHLPTLLKAADRASQPEEQRLLAERLHTLTASRGADRPPLGQRLAVVGASTDRTLLESVALQGPEAELRRAALVKLERQGALGDAAITDPNPANRRLAAERITQQSTLQRVMEAVRKSDKALHQALRDRLHAQRLAAGDPEAVSQEGLRVCAALENLAATSHPPEEAEIASLEESWSGIADLAPKELRQRHDAVIRRLNEPSPRTGSLAVSEAKPASKPRQPDPAQESAVTDTRGPHPPRKTEAADRDVSARLDRLEAKLALLLDQLEAGELHKALVTRSEILDGGKVLGANPRWKHIQQEIHRVHGRLRELRDWQHWSNNKIRKRLIREMQALPGSGLHPDAVLQKLKELQAEWKELELSEQIPGEKHFSAPPSMWRKFKQAGRTAFELTKPFLDKRTEVQQSHLDEMRVLCEELDALSLPEKPDWKALGQAVSRASRGLRSLDTIPARARKKMSARLKKSLEAAHARLGEHQDEVEKAKRRLIRSAAQLEHMGDRDEAIALAKSLQAEWKASGSLRRGLEQKLWKEFRRPIDPLFERLKTERKAEQAEYKQDLEAQQALCGAMQDILDSDDAKLAEMRGKVQGLEEDWQKILRPSTRLRKEFQSLTAQFDSRMKQRESKLADADRERWWRKSDLLHTLEAAASGAQSSKAGDDARRAWPDASNTNGEIDAVLDKRCEAVLAGKEGSYSNTDPEAIEQGRLLCIQLEFLAGLPSPKMEQETRMKYQVDRLSASLTGVSERPSARQEAREAEREWLTLDFIPDPDHGRFRNRIRTALREIFKE